MTRRARTAQAARHAWRVASRFPPLSPGWLLGLAHDGVEDGWLPRCCLRWPALDAITRRPGEPYAAYIGRVKLHPLARRVKLADLRDNMSRNGGPPGDLLRRYRAAMEVLE